MPSIPIGTTLVGPNSETFKITDFLGQGAFGEVYRAVGDKSGTVVAVKLLPLGSLASPDSKAALLNEIKAAQQIKHPNVVEVLFVNDGTSSSIGPYVVMEYVSGGSLARVLRTDTQIPLERAIEMMIDIAQGARAINEKLIHRDIKPSCLHGHSALPGASCHHYPGPSHVGRVLQKLSAECDNKHLAIGHTASRLSSSRNDRRPKRFEGTKQ